MQFKNAFGVGVPKTFLIERDNKIKMRRVSYCSTFTSPFLTTLLRMIVIMIQRTAMTTA